MRSETAQTLPVATGHEVDLHERPPAWVAAQLPPRYAEITAEVDALHREAHNIEAIGALLWRTGLPLIQAVRDAFAFMGFATEVAGQPANYDLSVQLDRGRRLFIEVAASAGAVDRTSPKITQILQTIQLDATDQDRVIFMVNAYCDTPIQDRKQEPVTLDALKLIAGLGATLMTTSTLFATWRYSLQDAADARKIVNNFHAFVGGLYK